MSSEFSAGLGATNASQPPAVRTPEHTHAKEGRYELRNLLGSGGMGSVYRAFDRELNRDVAIKVIRQDLVSDSPTFECFQREVIVSSRITDEHVVRILDLTEIDGKPAIVMEWVDSGSLAQHMANVHCLPPSQVWDFARQIAQGLRAIHRAGIVHRDLKPGNLLICSDGRMLIADFGLARSTSPQNSSPAAIEASSGTPAYMSPEQRAGLPAEPRSDIFALGLILLFMLTGSTDFEEMSALSLRTAQSQGDRHVRRAETRKLAVLHSVIGGCLVPARSERFPSADAVLAALDSAGGEILEINNGHSQQAGNNRKLRLRRGLVAIVVLGISAWGIAQYIRPGHVAVPPGSAERFYAQGVSLSNARSAEPELRDALAAFDKALKVDPGFLPAATARVETLIKLFESSSDVNYISRARAALRSVPLRDPPVRAILQARIDLLTGSFQATMRDLQDPALLASSSNANRLMGRALEGSGQGQKALEYFKTAVRLDPESWLCHNDLGSLLLDLGYLPEASAQFRRVTELAPGSAAGYSNLGIAYLQAGSVSEARTAFEQALAIRPLAETYQNLGAAAFYSHQFASSVPYFRTASEMQPTNDQYVVSLADALRQTGRDSAARDCYLHALELLRKAEKMGTLTVKERCRRARAFAELGDPAAATAVLSAISAPNQEAQTVNYTFAVVALKQGRLNVARESIEKAIASGYPIRLARLDPDLAPLYR